MFLSLSVIRHNSTFLRFDLIHFLDYQLSEPVSRPGNLIRNELTWPYPTPGALNQNLWEGAQEAKGDTYSRIIYSLNLLPYQHLVLTGNVGNILRSFLSLKAKNK